MPSEAVVGLPQGHKSAAAEEKGIRDLEDRIKEGLSG